MERELPTIKIEGTEFQLDVGKLLLVQKGNPENTISFFEMEDKGNGYSFDYDRRSRNIPDLGYRESDITTIHLFQLVEMDPQGMAEKYGLSLENMDGKDDFDLMVDQAALKQRQKGRLTTIEIEGHTFYVDIPMDRLRPKDDFLSKGIVFSEIDHYYEEEKQLYSIPYNASKHEFQEVDFENLTELPKGLILIEFPYERILDPIGFNRKHGVDPLWGLKETGIKSHFEARKVDWKETGLEEMIEENRKRLGVHKSDDPPLKASRQRKGRGI